MSNHEGAAGLNPGSSPRVVVPVSDADPQRAAKMMTVRVRQTKRRRKPQGGGGGEPQRNDDVITNEIDKVSVASIGPAQPSSPAAEAAAPDPAAPPKKLVRKVMVCRRVRRRKSHSAAVPAVGGGVDGESPSSLTPQPTEPEQQQVSKDLSLLPNPSLLPSPAPSVLPRRHHRNRHHRTSTAPHVKLPTANEAPLVATSTGGD